MAEKVCLLLQQRGHPEDDDSTDNGRAKLPEQTTPLYSEEREEPTAERASEETQQEIHDEAEATTLH